MGVKDCVVQGADVSVPDAFDADIVYGVPTTPANVQPDALMTPAAADVPRHEARVPPDVVSVTETVDDVTTLPAESSTLMTGWVLKGEPEALAIGYVVKTS